jgi:hypothetical protein
MSDGIRGRVVGVAQVKIKLNQFSDRAARQVATAVQQQGILLQNTVRAKYLMGVALNKRTGRLINSINTQFRTDGTTSTSRTGTALSYGRFWELGFHGVEHVREHTRTVASRAVVGFREDLKSKRGKIAEGIAFVRAFDRMVDQNARPFLQPALEERRPSITEALQAAVAGAI